jgi:hypothetical protein
VVYHFVADGYQMPREETLCREEIRSQLASQGHSGKKLAFFAPTRSRVSNDRFRLSGEVVILAENLSAEYRCEVDSRGTQVLDASVAASR